MAAHLHTTAVVDANTSVVAAGAPASSKPSRYIRSPPPRDDMRFVRADSEPINVSSHLELYSKLNSMWQQANTLISSSGNQSQLIKSPASSDGESMDIPTPTIRRPTQPISIVDTEVFKLIYSNPANVKHFSITKQEIPFAETIHNREYLTWVAMKEPGITLNYDEIRHSMARLAKEQLLRQHSPNVFNFFNSLLRAHEAYVLRGARFLSYELHADMIDAYYGTPGDVALLSRFPVTEPAAFQEYIATSSKAMSEQAVNNRKRNRTELYQQWKETENALLNIKSGREFIRRHDQLQKLMKIFRNRSEERSRRNRALRAIQSSRKVDRKRVVKAANIDMWRQSVGQAGTHDLDNQQLQLLQMHMVEQSQAYSERHENDDTAALPGQMQDMKIDDSAKFSKSYIEENVIHA